jgi:hypothetical protein
VCECVGGDRVAICPYKVREGGCVACAMGRFWRCATHARAPPRIGIMQRSGRGGMRLERVPTPHPHAPPVRDALAPTMQCNVASVCGGHLSLPPSPTSALQRGTRASRGLAITLHTIYTVHTSVLEWPTVVPPHHNHGCDPCHARHPQTAGVRSLQHFHIGNQVCVAGWRTEGGVGESDASSQHTHRDAKCGLPWRLRHGLAVARDETHDACSAPPLARAARLSHKASHSPNYHPIKRLPLGKRNLELRHHINQVPSFCVVCAWVALPSVSKHVR